MYLKNEMRITVIQVNRSFYESAASVICYNEEDTLTYINYNLFVTVRGVIGGYVCPSYACNHSNRQIIIQRALSR